MVQEIKTRLGIKKIEMIEWDEKYIPKTVYKYRDWKNDFHRKIVLDQEIYIPSPDSFNDPFDCRIPVAYNLLMDDPQLTNEYFRKAVRRLRPNLLGDEYENEVKKLINEGRYKDIEYLEFMSEKGFEKLNAELGVFCVTAVNDNVLMWAHYANNHEGFCVGFDSKKLFAEFGRGGDVHYVDEYPTILPTEEYIEQMYQQTNIKAFYWDYEIEYRLTKFGLANRTIRIPKDFINEIIIGYKMKEADEKDLLKIIELNLPHIKLRKTKPRKRSFEFELVNIK